MDSSTTSARYLGVREPSRDELEDGRWIVAWSVVLVIVGVGVYLARRR